MIDEKKLLEEIERSMNDNMHTDGKIHMNHVYEHQHFMRMVNSQPKVGEWIPCSERLPEEGEKVIACNKNGEIETAYFYPSEELSGATIWCANDVMFTNIVAWKPLPETYKG